jgi:hypothetical protein
MTSLREKLKSKGHWNNILGNISPEALRKRINNAKDFKALKKVKRECKCPLCK